MFDTKIAEKICNLNNLTGVDEYGSDAYWINDGINNLADLQDLFENFVIPTKNTELISEFVKDYLCSNYSKFKQEAYIQYILTWFEEHNGIEYEGMQPVCMEEFLEWEFEDNFDFDELCENLCDEGQLTCRENLLDYAIEMIKIDAISVAINVLQAVEGNYANYWIYDYSMGGMETPTPVNSIEDIEDML